MDDVIEGDCLEAMAAMSDESVDLVLTDPPYGIAYRSRMRIARERFDGIAGDEGFDPEWHEQWLGECHRVLRDDRHIYIFCSDHHLGDFRSAAERAGFHLKRTLVWVKRNGGALGDLFGDYMHMTEFVVFAMKGRRELLQKRSPNVLEIPKVVAATQLHPTEKPLGVLRPLLLNSTELGEVALDPFAGSGSTGAVAREEGRGYVLIEQDPRYVQVARERLAQGGLF